MPIFKYTASADTTITNGYKPYSITRAFYANMGAADSLETYSIYHSGSETEKSRILVKFPLESIIEARSAGTLPASGNVQFVFNLYNVEHPETLPKNYYVLIRPVSSSWDEGFGLDIENYSDTGQSGSKGYGAGWINRSTTDTTSTWNSYGGDYITGAYDKQFYFNDGTENISVDVTDIIESQIAGQIPNHGLGIFLSGAYENGENATTYYTKRFSARSSEYFYNVPSIEARWESILKDDRNNFYFKSDNLSNTDNLQNIYFYNRFNGVLKDLPNSVTPYVKLINSDGITMISNITSSKISTGTYRATLFVTGTEDETLNDIWYSGSLTYYSGAIEAKVRLFDDTFVEQEHVFALTNLKATYKNYEKPNIRIFGRYKDWSPTIYKIANKNIETLTYNNLYYKIIRIVDNKTIIDYGIEPVAYTKCSYDKNGNYFTLDMSMFEVGYAYGIKFMLLNGDIKLELPNTFRFKVE